MATLNPLYIVQSDLETYLIDKDTGLPLAGGLLYFYRDADKIVPKPVYQLGPVVAGEYTYVVMPNPVTLSSVGTVQNASGDNVVIYWYPWMTDPDTGQLVLDLYYVNVENSGGTQEFSRDAWPNVTSANSPAEEIIPSQSNQIANPTFTNTFLNPGMSTIYTVSSATNQVFAFAPDWNFVISGTGTVTVQIISIMGSQNVIGSPPYMLDVLVSAGVTQCLLVQNFPANAGLWSSTPDNEMYLYGSFVAKNVESGSANLEMFYVDNSGTPVGIVDATFDGTYTLNTGISGELSNSTNTGSGVTGYVQIYLSFTTNSHVQVSAIQLVPTLNSTITVLPYDMDSSNRNEALQGDYYLPRAVAKQIDSYLVGWDFPVNPYQFATSGTVTTTANYIVDQTIAQSATNSVTWGQDAVTNGLKFTTTGTSDAFYILQYLSAPQVDEMVANGNIAVNVFATVNSNPVTMRVYLFYGDSSSTIPALNTTIGTIAADGVFTLTATNWAAVPRNGLPIAQTALTGTQDYSFTGWTMPNAATNSFAIVVTFDYTNNGTILTANSISVVPGDLPCRPAIKSLAATLLDCQYYYEASGAIEIQNSSISYNISTVTNVFILAVSPFDIEYNSVKRIAITPSFNPLTFSYWVNGVVSGPAAVNINRWVPSGSSVKGIAYLAGGTAPPALATGPADAVPQVTTGCIIFNYVADARLGIV